MSVSSSTLSTLFFNQCPSQNTKLTSLAKLLITELQGSPSLHWGYRYMLCHVEFLIHAKDLDSGVLVLLRQALY